GIHAFRQNEIDEREPSFYMQQDELRHGLAEAAEALSPKDATLVWLSRQNISGSSRSRAIGNTAALTDLSYQAVHQRNSKLAPKLFVRGMKIPAMRDWFAEQVITADDFVTMPPPDKMEEVRQRKEEIQELFGFQGSKITRLREAREKLD